MKVIKKLIGLFAIVDIAIVIVKALMDGGLDLLSNGISSAVNHISTVLLGSDNLIFGIALILLGGTAALLSVVATVITLFQRKLSGNVSVFSYFALTIETSVGCLFVVSCMDKYSSDKMMGILGLVFIVLIALFDIMSFIKAFQGDEVVGNIDMEGYNKYIEAQQAAKLQEREKAKAAKKSHETDFEIERNDEPSDEEKKEPESETQDVKNENNEGNEPEISETEVSSDKEEENTAEPDSVTENAAVSDDESSEPKEESSDEEISEESAPEENESAPENETVNVDETAEENNSSENSEEAESESSEETASSEPEEEKEEEVKEGPRVLEIEDDDVQDLSHVNKFVVRKSFEEQMMEREAQMAREKQTGQKEEKFDAKMTPEEKLEQRFSSFRDGDKEAFELATNDQSVLEMANEDVEEFEFNDKAIPIDPANRVAEEDEETSDIKDENETEQANVGNADTVSDENVISEPVTEQDNVTQETSDSGESSEFISDETPEEKSDEEISDEIKEESIQNNLNDENKETESPSELNVNESDIQSENSDEAVSDKDVSPLYDDSEEENTVSEEVKESVTTAENDNSVSEEMKEDEAAKEPVKEEKEVTPEPVSEDESEKEEPSDEDDEEENEDDEKGNSFSANFGPAKSMDEKFDAADDQLKINYSKIKNLILSYKKVSCRTSKSCETFRLGYNNVCKLVIRGKSIKVYLPLDPESLDPNVYHQKDASSVKKYESVPTCIKVRSNLSCKKTMELITLILSSAGLGATKNEKYKEVDYTKSMNPEK